MDSVFVPGCAAVLIAVGIALFIRPRWLIDFWLGPRIFDAPKWACLHPHLRERLRAALIRRRVQIAPWPSYVCGSVQIVVAVIALFWHFTLPMLFAAWAMGTAPVLAFALAQAGPGSTARRVASLQPRKALSPAVLISTAAVTAVSLIAFLTGTREGIMMGVAAAVCGVSALFLASAPAILTGEDLAAEQFVDQMVRSVQTMSISVFGTLAAVVMMTSHATPEWAKESAFAAYFVSWFAFYFSYRIPNEQERMEMVQ